MYYNTLDTLILDYVFVCFSVDDFREVALLMLKTHKFGGQCITNGRAEFLPVHWYGSLCPEELGTEE